MGAAAREGFGAAARAKSQSVPYRLVNVAPGCRRILEITRLDAILSVS